MNLFGKLAFAGALTAAALAAMPAAAATNFIGTYTITANTDANNGLDIDTSKIVTNLNFNLNPTAPGNTTAFDLFRISTPEGHVDNDDDNPKPIKVHFNFTAPGASAGDINGTTVGEELSGNWEQGKLTWANGGNVTLNFAGGISLLAHLDNAIFGKDYNGLDSDTTNVKATFTMSQTPAGPGGAVPEPATWAMMIMGFGMVGAGLRLRREQPTLA